MPESAHRLEKKAIPNHLLAARTGGRLAAVVDAVHAGAQVKSVRGGGAKRMVRVDHRLAVHRSIELVDRLGALLTVKRVAGGLRQVLGQTIAQVVQVGGQAWCAGRVRMASLAARFVDERRRTVVGRA